MTHPLIPDLLHLATPIAENLGLEVVDIVFQTNKRPPVLRVDIRNLAGDTGLEDCEQMSRFLETALDSQEVLPGSYVLEISSPGISRQLSSEREFQSFKGFPVIIIGQDSQGKPKEWRGKLQGRDEQSIYLNQKGRSLSIDRNNVIGVRLDERRDHQ